MRAEDIDRLHELLGEYLSEQAAKYAKGSDLRVVGWQLEDVEVCALRVDTADGFSMSLDLDADLQDLFDVRLNRPVGVDVSGTGGEQGEGKR